MAVRKRVGAVMALVTAICTFANGASARRSGRDGAPDVYKGHS